MSTEGVTDGSAPGGTGTGRSPSRSRYDSPSVGAAVLFLLWSRTIDVNPMQRVGQVSGEAVLQARFAVAAIVLVAAMLAVRRWGPPAAGRLAARLGCAVAAGLTTGLVAGGIAVAVRGTPWALWAGGGDYAPLIAALQTHDLRQLPSHYPPLFPAIMGAWSSLSGKPLAQGLQDLQLLGTAMFGPAAYLAWRLVLRPGWALLVGVVAMLPFIEPVKPYPQITLVMVVPVFVFLLRTLRRSAALSPRRAAAVGLGFGVGLGLLFLLYSGWFVWCAPGLVAAARSWCPGARPGARRCC